MRHWHPVLRIKSYLNHREVTSLPVYLLKGVEAFVLFEEYSKVVIAAIQAICETQKDEMSKAADLAARTIEADGLIYVFGCGHSGILSCEGFYRAGGLACVAPVFEEKLMLHESAVESSVFEKQEGFADCLKERYHLEKNDLMICVSTSDKNAVRVEYAEYVRSLGIPTIAISSSAYYHREVTNVIGKHLHEICDVFIDNKAPYGDACLSISGQSTPMAPISTITGVFILNGILADAAKIASEHGFTVPVYSSGNIEGGMVNNHDLIEKYASRIPHLGGV